MKYIKINLAGCIGNSISHLTITFSITPTIN